MQRTAYIAAAALVALSLSAAGWCSVEWGLGGNISGDIEDKEIEIAASSNEEGPSTDTLGWEEHPVEGFDLDSWIDPEQSPPDDAGDDDDDLGSWSEASCWWTASHGTVTQGSFDTTWTAPYEQGAEVHIEIAVNDQPRTIPPEESGVRDDEREYFGTPAAKKAKAYWITWSSPRIDGPTSHDFDFNWIDGKSTSASPCGDGQQLGIVDPDDENCNGFHKKVELLGQLAPPDAGVTFALKHKKKGVVLLDDEVFQNMDYPEWTNDETANRPTTDQDGCVYVWDAPGVKFPGGWWKASDSEEFTWDMAYRDRARYKGRLCSDSGIWGRVIVLTGIPGQTQWNKPADTNN